MKTTSRLMAALLGIALGVGGSSALSQGGPGAGGYGQGMGGYGPGMMGGQGPGMMSGYGGYGPGRAGGYGPGMHGYGGGMMGGYGPGMMGGYGAGDAGLDLTDDQRQKLATLGEQSRRRMWETTGQLRSEQFRLRELLRADPVNVSAVVDQQARVDELRRQLLKSRIEARNDMAAVLAPEQRKRLREAGPWWYRGELDD